MLFFYSKESQEFLRATFKAFVLSVRFGLVEIVDRTSLVYAGKVEERDSFVPDRSMYELL